MSLIQEECCIYLASKIFVLKMLKFLVLLCFVFINSAIVKANAPLDREARAQTPLDIFLNELLPFKAQFVLKNVRSNCSKLLAPLIDTCYKNYELESKYTLALKGTTEELKVGCCNLWSYHECVIDAVESLAHYSFKACNEYDADAAEQVLEATESHPKSKLMCSDYHRQSFYCSTTIESSLTMTLVLIIGFIAILAAAMMAGYTFFLSTLRVQVVYVHAARGFDNDGVELLERGEVGFGQKMVKSGFKV